MKRKSDKINKKKTYKRNKKKTYRRNKKKTYKRNKIKLNGGAFRKTRGERTKYDPYGLDDSSEVTDTRGVAHLTRGDIPEYNIDETFHLGSDGVTVCYRMTNNLNDDIIYIRWRLLNIIFNRLVNGYSVGWRERNPAGNLRLSTKYRSIHPNQANFVAEIKSRISEINEKLRIINRNEEYKRNFDNILHQARDEPSLDGSLCFDPSPYKVNPFPDLINDNFQFDEGSRYCVCSMEVGYPVHSSKPDFHFFIVLEDNSEEGGGRLITLGFNNSKDIYEKDELGAYSVLFPGLAESSGSSSSALTWDVDNAGAYTCMDYYTATYRLNKKGLFGPFEDYNKYAFTSSEKFEDILFTDWNGLRIEERSWAESLGLTKDYWNTKYWDDDNFTPPSFNVEGTVLSENYEDLTDSKKDNIRKLTKYSPDKEGSVDIVRDKETWDYKKLELSHPYTNGCKIRKVVNWKHLSDIQVRFMNKIKGDKGEYSAGSGAGVGAAAEVSAPEAGSRTNIVKYRDFNIYQTKYNFFQAHTIDDYPEYPWIYNHAQLLDEKGNNRKIEDSIVRMKNVMVSAGAGVTNETFDDIISSTPVWDAVDLCNIQSTYYPSFCCLEGSILFHNLDNYEADYKEEIIAGLGKELTRGKIRELMGFSSSSDGSSDGSLDGSLEMEEMEEAD